MLESLQDRVHQVMVEDTEALRIPMAAHLLPEDDRTHSPVSVTTVKAFQCHVPHTAKSFMGRASVSLFPTEHQQHDSANAAAATNKSARHRKTMAGLMTPSAKSVPAAVPSSKAAAVATFIAPTPVKFNMPSSTDDANRKRNSLDGVLLSPKAGESIPAAASPVPTWKQSEFAAFFASFEAQQRAQAPTTEQEPQVCSETVKPKRRTVQFENAPGDESRLDSPDPDKFKSRKSFSTFTNECKQSRKRELIAGAALAVVAAVFRAKFGHS